MDNAFQLTLSDEEKLLLHECARRSIAHALQLEQLPLPKPAADSICNAELGAFVTLTLDGSLRGCIGNIVGRGPLYGTVAAMALAAAFKDHRFRPLTAEEFKNVEISISIMGPVTPCQDPSAVVIGRHGLIIRQGERQGLLLPQVPVEWNWDRETFLAQTCRKAGLPPDAWKNPETQLFWFEAEVI